MPGQGFITYATSILEIMTNLSCSRLRADQRYQIINIIGLTRWTVLQDLCSVLRIIIVPGVDLIQCYIIFARV